MTASSPPRTNNSKRRLLIISGGIILACLVIITFLFWPHRTAPITNYRECIEAGNPISESNPPVCRADGLRFVGPAESVSNGPVGESVAFDILVNGDLVDQHPRATEVINDQRSWASYWARIHSGLAKMPPLLPVDFTKSTVLAINEGPQLTNGHVYKITGVTQLANTAIADVTESIPTISCPVARIESNRYYIVRVDKLNGDVSFRTTVDHRQCGVNR